MAGRRWFRTPLATPPHGALRRRERSQWRPQRRLDLAGLDTDSGLPFGMPERTRFTAALDDLRQRGPEEDAMQRVVGHAEEASDDDLALLAVTLAHSGRVLPPQPGSCDVASTGGPSSLTTLLSPLLLRTRGFAVPKVGVPGRPAGAIDVLATLRGFRSVLSGDEFLQHLAAIGYVHAAAGADLAPLDGSLFSYRKRMHAVDSPPLAIASLLSKKIAVGLTSVVLDVRVWRGGNLGKDQEAARSHARRFNRVAALLGIDATCVLTDLESGPYQPYIGRGESLIALCAALDREADPWLSEHGQLCLTLANCAQGGAHPADFGEAMGVLQRHLHAQGSSVVALRARVSELVVQPRQIISAQRDGPFAIDLDRVRAQLVAAQGESRQDDDPAGIRMLARPGEVVARDQPLVEVRHASSELLPSLATAIASFTSTAVGSMMTPPEIIR